VGLPAIEIGLRGFDALEAHSCERRALRVAHAGLDLCPCDRDRARDKAARRRRSERARRGTEDLSVESWMSGVMTPSRRLSSTTTRGTPPSWRKARSYSSAQMRDDDFQDSRRTDFRLHPSVSTKSLTRLYLPLSRSRTIGPSP
jgi:hypothetical protein